MSERQDDVIKREFAKQASYFGQSGLTLGKAELLDWIVENLALEAGGEILDVAAGTGHLSRAMAPHVGSVIAFDLTPEMLEQARLEASRAGLANIEFVQGNAVDLPYGDGAVPMVTSRLAIHHFADPRVQVAEMARVCAPGGRVAVVDLVAPDEPDLADSYNRIERLRDPSHTYAPAAAALVALYQDVGLECVHSASCEVPVAVEPWAAMTETPVDVLRGIRDEMEQELAGGPPTGTRPFRDGDVLKFMQTWQVHVFRKA